MALISLDVFDTAIFRKVFKPTDIFHVIEDEVGYNFHSLRIEAQNKARKKSIFYNIFDIYKYIPQFDLKEEIKAEYSNCKANPYILDMYNNSNDEFIFISDMYLPEKVIVGMLERCGYKNPKVFVSCDYKAVKGDGKLFKVVEEAIGRKIDKHIGDNYSCDILGAKRARINETEYIGPAIYNKEVVTPELDNVKLRKLLIDEELSNNDIAEKIGYLFAPLTLAFTKSVLDEAKDDQTIFFNARDSFLMYIVARWILKTKKKIKYCRFSRKSCFTPAIDVNRNIDNEVNKFIFDFFSSRRCKSINEFLRIFELEGDCSFVASKYGISPNSDIELLPNKKQILMDTTRCLQKEIYEKAVQYKRNFLKYIEDIEMRNSDVFIDIGYNGSMQALIKRIAKIDLKGRYLNTFNKEQEYRGIPINKESFLDIGFFGFKGGVVEVVFSEPKGTVQYYNELGKPVISTDHKLRKNITKKITKGIFKGVREILAQGISPDVKDCQKIIERFFKQPCLEEAEFFNQEIFENGSLKDESITWFNKDLIKKGKIKECYSKSYWKEAFKLLLDNSEYKGLKGLIK